jgi:hypothetical protein
VLSRNAASKIAMGYRTGHTIENREIFAMMSGLNVGAFSDPGWPWGMDDVHITADWAFDAALARHGYASLGLVPQCAEMIDNTAEWMAAYGMTYAKEPVESRRNPEAFELYKRRMTLVRKGQLTLPFSPILKVPPAGLGTVLMFAHQLNRLNSKWTKDGWAIAWDQGYGPFAFVSKVDGAEIEFDAMGRVAVICSTLPGYEGRFQIFDDKHWQRYEVLTPGMPLKLGVHLEGPGLAYRTVSIKATGPGAVLHGIRCNPQPLSFTSGFQIPKEFFEVRKIPY